MHRNQRTLVALSGSLADRPLVTYARQFAALGFARHYHFVHVRTPAQMVDDPREEHLILEYLETVVGELFNAPGVSASCHVLQGVRVDQLIEFSTSQRCDLIVLGHRRDRSGQRRLARRLALVGPSSVLMIPEGAPLTITSIMAPVDFSDHSADSVQVAASIAQAAGLKQCVLTHVYTDPSLIRYDEHKDEIRRNEQEAFDKFIAPIDNHGVSLEPYFIEGNNVPGTILYAAEKHSSDLIVLNTRGRSRAASILLGSVTSQVLTQSPVAVLAVKHFGSMMNLFQALKESRIWTQKSPRTN